MSKPCRCHADDTLYGGLATCPTCGHRSYDRLAGACERRKCEGREEITHTEATTSE